MSHRLKANRNKKIKFMHKRMLTMQKRKCKTFLIICLVKKEFSMLCAVWSTLFSTLQVDGLKWHFRWENFYFLTDFFTCQGNTSFHCWQYKTTKIGMKSVPDSSSGKSMASERRRFWVRFPAFFHFTFLIILRTSLYRVEKKNTFCNSKS